MVRSPRARRRERRAAPRPLARSRLRRTPARCCLRDARCSWGPRSTRPRRLDLLAPTRTELQGDTSLEDVSHRHVVAVVVPPRHGHGSRLDLPEPMAITLERRTARQPRVPCASRSSPSVSLRTGSLIPAPSWSHSSQFNFDPTGHVKSGPAMQTGHAGGRAEAQAARRRATAGHRHLPHVDSAWTALPRPSVCGSPFGLHFCLFGGSAGRGVAPHLDNWQRDVSPDCMPCVLRVETEAAVYAFFAYLLQECPRLMVEGELRQTVDHVSAIREQ